MDLLTQPCQYSGMLGEEVDGKGDVGRGRVPSRDEGVDKFILNKLDV